MKARLLTLRVSRRAIAAAQIDNESLTFATGQHLTSGSDRAVAAATRYLGRILEAVAPSVVIIDTPPRPAGSVTDRIMNAIEELINRRGLQVLSIAKPELLAAYGHPGLRNRRELRMLVDQFWPELRQVVGRVQPFVADAAAAALYAETRLVLERVPA